MRDGFAELRGQMKTGFDAATKRVDSETRTSIAWTPSWTNTARKPRTASPACTALIGGISGTLTDHEERLRELEGE